MVELQILGSSSKGNCYLFKSSEETLILEAGVSFKEISKALSFHFDNVSGCLVSHRHGDHSLALPNLDGLVPIYASSDVINFKKVKMATIIENGNTYDIGGFKVIPFEAIHDVPCQGFFIFHKEMGRLAFITDSAYSEYEFEGVNHLMVECNYTSDTLETSINNGTTPYAQRSRLINTHMELQETMDVIENNISDKLYNVILIHLSGRNSNELDILQTITNKFGLTPIIAKPKLSINLNKDIY